MCPLENINTVARNLKSDYSDAASFSVLLASGRHPQHRVRHQALTDLSSPFRTVKRREWTWRMCSGGPWTKPATQGVVAEVEEASEHDSICRTGFSLVTASREAASRSALSRRPPPHEVDEAKVASILVLGLCGWRRSPTAASSQPYHLTIAHPFGCATHPQGKLCG